MPLDIRFSSQFSSRHSRYPGFMVKLPTVFFSLGDFGSVGEGPSLGYIYFHAVLRESNRKNIVFGNHLGWTLTPRNPGFKLKHSLI